MTYAKLGLRRAAKVLAALALSAGVGAAQASVVTTSTLSPGASLFVGDSLNYSVTIAESGVPGGYLSEKITAVSYSFLSGDGQTFSGSLSGLYNDTVNLSQGFTYASAGSFSPTFSATVTTSDAYTYSYQVLVGYNYYHYSCGFFSTCTQEVPIYQTQTETRFDNLDYSTGVTDSVSVAPVPVPGAVWLMGSGLLGLVVTRRRRQGQASDQDSRHSLA